MKLYKNASGKSLIKLSQKEWEQIGKEAGWWDATKQIGRGVGQGIKSVWNVGRGAVGLLGSALQGMWGQVQKIKQQMQKEKATQEHVTMLNQMTSELQQLQALAQQQMQEDENDPELQQLRQNAPARAASTKIQLKKNASGKDVINLSREKWLEIGIKTGFAKKADFLFDEPWDDDEYMYEEQEMDWAGLKSLVDEYNSWMDGERVMSASADQATDTFALFLDGQEITRGSLPEITERVKQIRKEEGIY